MKKIGSGWQVNVYEYSADTVYKVPHKGLFRYLRVLRDLPFMIFTPRILYQWIQGLEQSQKDSLHNISHTTELWQDLAYPVFESTGAYYQQKVVPLHKYIKNLSEQEFKSLIDDFVIFVSYLHTKGFIDKSFNFLKNFGILNSKIVLADLGELFCDEQQIQKQIKNRAWSKHYVVLMLSKKYRQYFNSKMDAIFLTQVEKQKEYKKNDT